MPARKADSFESELWTDDSTFSHGEQTVSRPNVHGVCEANESESSEKKQVPYVRRSGVFRAKHSAGAGSVPEPW